MHSSTSVREPPPYGASLARPWVTIIQPARRASALFAPVDIAALVYFRIAFGLLMAWEILRYLGLGYVRLYWIEPAFHFTYLGFEWVKPWPGSGMITHFLVLALLALCIAIGYWYRVAATLFFLGFAYVFLLDQAQYLNHFYLIVLISFLLIFMPAHHAFSIDAWRRPELRSQTVPAWTLWLLRTQIALVYFFGGVAKLNADWLSGKPLNIWLARHNYFPLIGVYVSEPAAAYLFSYGGLLLDLGIVPFLLWRKTRLLAFGITVLFHLTNSRLFSIGVFPWLMIAATAMFFAPDWPTKFIRRSPAPTAHASTPGPTQRALTVGLLAIYLVVQILLPLRHWLYPGNVSWTEEGHRFSWHMMLRTKTGTTRFFVTDPATGESWEEAPTRYLAHWQIDEMAKRPDMILQLSHHIAKQLEAERGGPVEVRVEALVSLNGRAPQLLIDPTVDLAAQLRTWRPATWILPLEDSLGVTE